MKKEKSQVKLLEKFGYAGLSMSNNIVFNFKSLYYLSFLKMILNIPVFWASTILTIGTIWDAINDPLIGYWSVNHKFKTGEKIRPLAKIFAIPWGLSVIAMYANFFLPQTATIILCIVIYIVFEAFYTFLCIPYNSLAALASNVDADRRSINSFRSIGGLLGTLIGALLIPTLVKSFGGLKSAIYTQEDSAALLKTAILMAVISIVGCLFFYFTTKERIHQKDDNEEHIGFLETFKMLFSIKSWVANLMFILCYGIASALVMNEVNDYAAYIYGDSSFATPVLGVYIVVALIGSIAIVSVDEKLGRKNTMIITALVQVVGKIPFIIWPHSVATIFINAATSALGIQGAFVLFNTNRNNVADIVEFKYGRRIDSMVATCDNLITKLAEALAVWLMGVSLQTSGYDAVLGINQTLATQNTICALLGWVPALVCIAMAYFAYKCNIQEEYKTEQINSETNKQ
ncbi:MAG: MFS transporter [Firmicutes bacterium]|nr:MFS transporter [Candidatus Colivicinus equi]